MQYLPTVPSLSLASLEKSMPITCIEKGAAKYLNQSWRIRSAVFFLTVARQTTSSFSSKFSRKNLRSTPKTFTHHLLVDLDKAHDRVDREKILGLLWE